MSFLSSVIKKLQLAISPSWNKTSGNNSTESKIKAKNVDGDIAARDINKTYNITSNRQDQDSPYVYVIGNFGGNGHIMHFQLVKLDNTSNELIFLDNISFLNIHTPLNSKLVKPKETVILQTWNGMEYPTSNKNQWLEFEFHTRNGNKFVARQKLIFSSRVADDKYNVSLDTNVEIIQKK